MLMKLRALRLQKELLLSTALAALVSLVVTWPLILYTIAPMSVAWGFELLSGWAMIGVPIWWIWRETLHLDKEIWARETREAEKNNAALLAAIKATIKDAIEEQNKPLLDTLNTLNTTLERLIQRTDDGKID